MICNFYLSVAARTTVCVDPSLRYTSMLLRRSASNIQTPMGSIEDSPSDGDVGLCDDPPGSNCSTVDYVLILQSFILGRSAFNRSFNLSSKHTRTPPHPESKTSEDSPLDIDVGLGDDLPGSDNGITEHVLILQSFILG